MKKLNMLLALSAAVAIVGAGTIVMAQSAQDECRQDERSMRLAPFDSAKPQMGMDRRGSGQCGMQGTPPEMEKGYGPKGMDLLFMIEIENPEKAKALNELKDSKPEEFRKALKFATDEIFEKQKKDREEFRKLLDQYKENPSDELKARIRSKLAADFDRKMKVEEKMLSRMEEELNKTKEKIEKQKSMKDRLIDLKLGTVVFEQELRW